MNHKLFSGFRTSGSRATDIVEAPTPEKLLAWITERKELRDMSMETFIEHYGSGTLRKNARIGMNVQSHYLSDRIHFEFGAAFEAVMERSLTWGEARSEPDSKSLTEVGWFCEVYAARCLFPGDEMEVKYLTIEPPGGTKREGIGLILRKTSATWIPKGFAVFALITELDHSIHDWLPAVNPC